jgi:AcrR family transcriptional regulator
MFIYFTRMRTKCEEKQAALFEATVKLVNEIGFAASSVAKIAKEAKVSSATLYIYYKNKEDLLVSTYLAIKRHTSKAILENFDARRPIRDILESAWFNMFRYAMEHSQYFHFAEQFANSPYADLIDLDEVESYFEPIIQSLQSGIDQKIVKNVSTDILKAFIYYPIVALSNSRMCKDFEICDENMKTAFGLAWDAIKIHSSGGGL